MTDFPSSNETLATATNLGFISRYNTGGSVNAIRNDSINTPPPSSTDKYDYFTFRHTTGLTHVYITVTLGSSGSSTYTQALNLDLLNGFRSTPGVQIYDYGGISPPVNGNPSSQFNTTTKTFVFKIDPNSTQSTFVITGLHGEGPNLTYTDLDYSLKVHVRREIDLREKTLGTNASEAINGTNRDDYIIARGGNDVVHGLRRNDDIRGDNGNDRLYGDHGHDRLNGGNGNDIMYGGDHNDTILGGRGNDRGYGQNGNDFIRGGTGRDLLSGANGNDRIYGDADNDRILGGSGSDLLRGGTGNDLIRGGTDNDRIFGDAGVDRIFGDAGHDIIYGGTENDVIRGGTGQDTIFGDSGNDTIFGDEEFDVLYGNDGDDIIDGGDDNDFIYGGADRDSLYGGNQDDTLSGESGADYLDGGSGNDFLYGGDQNDRLDGGTGADYLDGGTGNDTILPGADLAVDTIIGGSGTDTVDYSNATGQVFVFLRDDFSDGAAFGDTYNSVENVIGSNFIDGLQPIAGGTAFGRGGNDTLYGGADFNGRGNGGTIRGDAGSDTLNMRYGDTNAWVQLGQGADIIDYFIEGQDKLFVDLSEFNLGTALTTSELRNSTTVTKVGSHAQFIFEGDAQRLWYDPDGVGAQSTVLIATFRNSSFDEAGTPALDINDFDWIF